jgi:hypothetical protein
MATGSSFLSSKGDLEDEVDFMPAFIMYEFFTSMPLVLFYSCALKHKKVFRNHHSPSLVYSGPYLTGSKSSFFRIKAGRA